MLHPSDLPLEARIHRPLPTPANRNVPENVEAWLAEHLQEDCERETHKRALTHYPKLERQHRREQTLARIKDALRSGDTGFALFSTVVSLVVLIGLAVFA